MPATKSHRYHGPSERRLTVLAQDPSIVTASGKAITTRVTVPAESVMPGPKGHRVHVVDYDTSTSIQYAPRLPFLNAKPRDGRAWREDPFAGVTDIGRLVADPHFHQQNVYAIVMSTLFDFEAALGRHVKWAFEYGAHQMKVAPHAFADANAFYSRRDEGLMFGYFPGTGGENVFTCLSYDIVAHETTHAILDGLRKQFDRPSSADQAAFHEAFADIVAILSVLRSEEMIEQALLRTEEPLPRDRAGRYEIATVLRALRKHSFLFGLADQMGKALDPLRRDALRRSVELPPSPKYLDQPAFQEAHRRGEILVAALVSAFLDIWHNRLERKVKGKPPGGGNGAGGSKYEQRWRIIEEGASAAQHLLRMAIRAIDYMPPLHITFGDFVSALVTADSEAVPDDTRYDYRTTILASFAKYGISPASGSVSRPGLWRPPDCDLTYGHAHADPMQWDSQAVFRFLWENREPLGLDDDALTIVESVRPVARLSGDGFVLRETVVEYYQLLDLEARELARVGVKAPKGMNPGQQVRLYGGGTMLFDEFGHVKYLIGTRLRGRRQSARLEQLWQRGAFAERTSRRARRFAQLHLDRRSDSPRAKSEQW
jgi:hypothetical protein